MSPDYTCVADLAREAEIPSNGILGRTLQADDRVKITVFAFGARQELSHHTVSTPAITHIIQGEARLTLGDDTVEAQAGA